jgi:hypothetical protein
MQSPSGGVWDYVPAGNPKHLAPASSLFDATPTLDGGEILTPLAVQPHIDSATGGRRSHFGGPI